MRVDEPKRRCGCYGEKKNLWPLSRFEPRTVRLLAEQRYRLLVKTHSFRICMSRLGRNSKCEPSGRTDGVFDTDLSMDLAVSRRPLLADLQSQTSSCASYGGQTAENVFKKKSPKPENFKRFRRRGRGRGEQLEDKISKRSRNGKKKRHCTYNVTLRRVRTTTVAVESNKYYIF